MRKATLKDIAQEAGVSSCLASKILNGKSEGVWASAETKGKILAAAEKLNYKPNISAKRLVEGRKDVIGIFFDVESDLKSLSITSTLVGMVARAEELGYSVNVGMARSSAKLQLLERGLVDSVILMPTDAENCAELQKLLRDEGVPYVFLNPGESIPFNSVSCDDKGGVRDAVAHLKSLGHERLAFLGRPSLHGSYKLRRDAFMEACGASGVDIPLPDIYPHMIVDGIKRSQGATAFILYHDEMLSPFYIACHSLGLEVGKDASVIGINDTIGFNKFLPKPTCVSIPVHEMGRRAVDMLDQLIRGGKPVPSYEFNEPLIVRESTSSPRSQGAKA